MRAASRRLSLLRLPRQRCLQLQNRFFHASTTAALPRNNPSSHDSDSQRTSANGLPTADTNESAVHDAENVSDKPIVRGATGRRAPRTSRSRQGLPPPPPIPSWFLKYNVRIYNDMVEGTVQSPNRADDVDIVDREEQGEGFKKFFKATMPEKEPTSSSGPDEATSTGNNHENRQSSSESKAASIAASVLEPPLTRLSTLNYTLLQAQLLVSSTFSLIKADDAAKSVYQSSNFVFNSPDSTSHNNMDDFVETVADLTQASIIRLDANDVAELTGTYIDGGNDGPGSMSNIAYDTYEGFESARSPAFSDATTFSGGIRGEEPADAAEQDQDEQDSQPPMGLPFGNMEDLKTLLEKSAKFIDSSFDNVKIEGFHIAQPGQGVQNPHNGSSQGSASQQSLNGSKTEVQTLEPWQELKLESFLDQLLTAPEEKESSDLSTVEESFVRQKFGMVQASRGPNPPRLSLWMALNDHVKALFEEPAAVNVYQNFANAAKIGEDDPIKHRTIVHIRDFGAVKDTAQGDVFVKRLAKVVAKRRRHGEEMIIIGTNSGYHPGVSNVAGIEDDDDVAFRTILLPPVSLLKANSPQLERAPMVTVPGIRGSGIYPRLYEINLRNIRDMIRVLRVSCLEPLFNFADQHYASDRAAARLGVEALSSAEIQRIVLFANGLREIYTKSAELDMSHISLACIILDNIDDIMRPPKEFDAKSFISNVQAADRSGEKAKDKKQGPSRPNLELLKKQCNKHEQRLLGGVVNPENIKTTFTDVHAPKETIEALKTVTTLSLMRPEAFQYGILANDRLPGLLLYGPPGTGKTLLAKAVAKDAKATVLDVSGAQIYEKYVGEGEKMVKAVFSLAKKLTPCVVFIDEADAIFASRGGGGSRTTHREIINQFLREWDGMDNHSVFIMVATNRPFDLDDAVLRRLPRKLLIDLPVASDRESILGIHLKGEALDAAVSMNKLAEQTPFYSGSDLKNMCVAAALAAVREENDLLIEHKDDADFKLPERRTLTVAHFDKAMQEISASISEDMSSLTAIKKFDEKYGDRRGRKKKTGYGFGGLTRIDENAARVRGDQRPSP